MCGEAGNAAKQRQRAGTIVRARAIVTLLVSERHPLVPPVVIPQPVLNVNVLRPVKVCVPDGNAHSTFIQANYMRRLTLVCQEGSGSLQA